MKNYGTLAATNDDVLRDAPGLEFPDWSGMVAHRSRMTFEQAVRWNEEMLSQFPQKHKLPKLQAECRCHAEFFL
ncbi:MAG TPA: hypothetical protein VGI03_13430 [Verrucomicrobiae bacterium]|jgi:hypothetical protein